MTMPITATTTRSGRGWAYTGAISGGLVSIAANVAHSFIPPNHAPTTWTPEAGAVVGAVVWPVFLFIAVEILARVTWPHGPVWRILRWGGMLPVAVVAALVSYRHLSGLLAHYGEEPIVYYLGPLAVDGLMVMATGALLATGRHHTTPAVPVVRHIGVPNTPPAPTIRPSTTDTAAPATIAGTPAASTTSPTSPVDVPADPAPVPETPPAKVPTPAQLAARITTARTTTRPAESATGSGRSAHTRPPRPAGPSTSASTLAPSTTDTPVSASDAAQLTPPTVPPDLLAKARQVARQYRTEHGAPITPGQLAVRLRVTSDQATQALAVLDLAPDSPTTPVPTVNGTRPAKAAR